MLTIGSRGSMLALAQTGWVKTQLLRHHPLLSIDIRIIRTAGDRDSSSSLRSGAGTGVFVKEIEEALMNREIDLAVHSMKDIPTASPDGLEIGAVPKREDPRDALITREDTSRLEELRKGAVVGTGSIRRQAQLLAARPDLNVRDIRGNVDTRLKKLADGQFDAIVLASAGLKRLGFQDRINSLLPLEQMLPAPGQGALALQMRAGDSKVQSLIVHLHHSPTATAVMAERTFLRCMGGGCNSPIAVYAALEDGQVNIVGLIASPDGKRIIRRSTREEATRAEQAAESLAEGILAEGGSEILKSCTMQK